jgi:glycosyltransferase involved in cell wall biosynthesis
VGKEKPMIFCPARLHPTKGVDLLIDAMAAVSTASELVIAGSGSDDDVEHLQMRATALGDHHNVRFVDSHDEALPDLYARSSVVAVPSVWPEPFGLVGLEAMAFGRPVVAFDVGGIGDWLAHDEVGLLAPAGDRTQLGACIERIVSDPVTARRMGAAGHARVQRRFSWDEHLRRFELAVRPRL